RLIDDTEGQYIARCIGHRWGKAVKLILIHAGNEGSANYRGSIGFYGVGCCGWQSAACRVGSLNSKGISHAVGQTGNRKRRTTAGGSQPIRYGRNRITGNVGSAGKPWRSKGNSRLAI